MPPRRSSRSSQQKKGKGKATDVPLSANWSDADTHFLIDQVVTRWSEGSTRLNFKKQFWQSISDSPALAKPEKGGPKTKSACKEKWSRIKKTYEAVNALTTASGFTYTHAKGADIGIEGKTVWSTFVLKHPAAAPFKHKGWPTYDRLKPIMPTKSKGNIRYAVPGTEEGPSSTPSNTFQEPPPTTSSESTSESEDSSGDTAGFEPLGSNPVPGVAVPPLSPSVAGSGLTPPRTLSHRDFTPPTVPSSYTGSLASSIKPSSSVSARAELSRSKKRKAPDDDDVSVLSVASPATRSAVGSTHSSRLKRRNLTLPVAVDHVGDRIGTLGDSVREGAMALSSAISSRISSSSHAVAPPPPINPVPDTESRKAEATKRLLSLDIASLAPSQIAAIVDCFQQSTEFADTYLTLAADTSPQLTAVWVAWLQRRLDEEGARKAVG